MKKTIKNILIVALVLLAAVCQTVSAHSLCEKCEQVKLKAVAILDSNN